MRAQIGQHVPVVGALGESGVEIELQSAHAGNRGGLGNRSRRGFHWRQGVAARFHSNYRHQNGAGWVPQRLQARADGHSAFTQTHRAGQKRDAGGMRVEEFEIFGTFPRP